MHSRITRVSLKNYRSIGSCDVELQPLTLLVGPNGSGKSNFLDSLRFLFQIMHALMEDAMQQREGIRSILQKQSDGQSAASFSIAAGFTLNDVPGHYSLKIGGTGMEGGFVVESEDGQVGAESFHVTPKTFRGNRPALVIYGQHVAYAQLFDVMGTMFFYSPDANKMRMPTPIGPGNILMPDASNAADVLERIRTTSPEVEKRIQGYLRSFNPEFSDVGVGEAGPYRYLIFRPATNPSGWSIRGSEVSDGTLRAVGILLAIFQGWVPNTPVSLIGLEEPEANLHPAAAGVLLDSLLEASTQVPIIASTHSADLLDRKDLPVSSLLAVALQDGETIIGPIDETGKAIIRERFYTAGELLRSNGLNPVSVQR